MALPAAAAAQQTGTVRGRVTEARTEAPVADAQVVLLNTQSGAITNANGEFTIVAAPTGAQQVTVRRIGFAPQTRAVTVEAGQTVRVDVALEPSATQLSQIVVTGTTGAVERRTIGNAVAQVNVAELTERNTILNVSEALQGKTPGVTILPGSGATGTAGEIRIRGASSVSGYQPVVFIDGIRYNISDLGGFSATGGGTAGLAQSSQITSALNWLNPNDIESIEVIKGPAAATLYGAEAANGVIQIITKKGNKGQQGLRWGFRAERGQTDWHLEPPRNYTTCDQTKVDARTVVGADTVPTWPGCQDVPLNSVISERSAIMTDPRAIRTGDLSRLSTTVRGGGDRYSFFLSGDRDAEQGVFRNNDQNRTSVRTNFSFTPNSLLDVSVNVGWQRGRVRLPIQDESANGLLLSSVRWLPGRRSILSGDNYGWRTISPTFANVYRNFTDSDRLTLGGTVNYNPFPWFRNRGTIGLDNTNSQAQLLFLPGEIDAAQDPDAAAGANLRRTPFARLITISYNGDLVFSPRRNLQSTTSFGSQVTTDERRRIEARGIGLGGEDVQRIDLALRTTGAETYSENNSVGYYVQEQLGWNDRLYITGAVRADDHSSFGTNFDMIVYPKVSVSYVVSEEPAVQRFTEAAGLNSLKLRGAWGRAGRAPTAYSAEQTFTVSRITVNNGATTVIGLFPSTYGNPNVRPEKGEELELGFEASALRDRIGADFTYYAKRTTDMLQSTSVAPSTGFSGQGSGIGATRLVNLGEVTNSGVELSLFGTPLDRRSFRWESRVNLATNRNRLESFGIAINGVERTVESPPGQAYAVVQQHRVGYPLGGFWVTPPLRCGVDALAPNAATTGVNACGNYTGSPQLTSAGAAIFNPGDTARRYLGSATPTREIGFSNTLTLFRYFRVYGLLDYKGGFKVFNLQERNRCQTANDNCWRTNNPRARFPQTGADTMLNRELAVYRSAGGVSPEWIQKGDFVKLRELSLSLDVPSNLLGFARAQSAQLVFSGRNLALWTDYEGTDPEVNSYGGRNFVRVDAYAAPMMRRFTAAINLTY